MDDDVKLIAEFELILVCRSRQRYNSEPGDTQSSYEGIYSTMPLLDDSAVVTVARVCHVSYVSFSFGLAFIRHDFSFCQLLLKLMMYTLHLLRC